MEFYAVYYFINMLRIFGIEKEKVTGGWRKLLNDDINFSLNIA
jgi:hypothetical protein